MAMSKNFVKEGSECFLSSLELSEDDERNPNLLNTHANSR